MSDYYQIPSADEMRDEIVTVKVSKRTTYRELCNVGTRFSVRLLPVKPCMFCGYVPKYVVVRKCHPDDEYVGEFRHICQGYLHVNGRASGCMHEDAVKNSIRCWNAEQGGLANATR